MGHSSATKLGDIKAISFVIVMVKKGIFWSTRVGPYSKVSVPVLTATSKES